MKCNTNGAAYDSPGPAGCGGIFRDSSAATLDCFAFSINMSNSLVAQLTGAMLAIEIVNQRGGRFLWLECDSLLVV